MEGWLTSVSSLLWGVWQVSCSLTSGQCDYMGCQNHCVLGWIATWLSSSHGHSGVLSSCFGAHLAVKKCRKERISRLEERWTDGWDEPVDRWNRWTDVNRWTEGTDGQTWTGGQTWTDRWIEWMDRDEQMDRMDGQRWTDMNKWDRWDTHTLLFSVTTIPVTTSLFSIVSLSETTYLTCYSLLIINSSSLHHHQLVI